MNFYEAFKSGDLVKITDSKKYNFSTSVWKNFRGKVSIDSHSGKHWYNFDYKAIWIQPLESRPDGCGLSPFWWPYEDLVIICKYCDEEDCPSLKRDI